VAGRPPGWPPPPPVSRHRQVHDGDSRAVTGSPSARPQTDPRFSRNATEPHSAPRKHNLMTVDHTRANTTRDSERPPTTRSESTVHPHQPTRRSDSHGHYGRAVEVPGGSWRERLRAKPGLGQAYRLGVFMMGLLFIALGFALAVLPGPLTIPPVLLGLWIWSTEFRFAKRFFNSFRRKAQEAWRHAKVRPLGSAAITVGGLAAAAAAAWAIAHFELVAKGQDAIGM